MTKDTADGVYFGLMSGTSMDGVDGVAVEFAKGKAPVVRSQAFVGFSEGLRDALFARGSADPPSMASWNRHAPRLVNFGLGNATTSVISSTRVQ